MLTLKKALDVDTVIPKIKLNENLTAPIAVGTKIGTIKYKVDDIEYSAKLLAKTNVEEVDYSIYIVISGLLLLMFALSMLKDSKKKKKRKKRR